MLGSPLAVVKALTPVRGSPLALSPTGLSAHGGASLSRHTSNAVLAAVPVVAPVRRRGLVGGWSLVLWGPSGGSPGVVHTDLGESSPLV